MGHLFICKHSYFFLFFFTNSYFFPIFRALIFLFSYFFDAMSGWTPCNGTSLHLKYLYSISLDHVIEVVSGQQTSPPPHLPATDHPSTVPKPHPHPSPLCLVTLQLIWLCMCMRVVVVACSWLDPVVCHWLSDQWLTDWFSLFSQGWLHTTSGALDP